MKLVIYIALILILPCPTVGQSNPDKVETASLIRTHGVKINVNDMEKALSFYCGKLGFEVEDRKGYPGYVVLKSDDRNRLILNLVKKLMRPRPTDTKFSFTLQVNDLDHAIERMRALGVRSPKPRDARRA